MSITGFDGYLTLPADAIAELALPFQSLTEVTLADGRTASTAYYIAKAFWDGYLREIYVVESEGMPLLGVSMMYGYDLFVRLIEGGAVRITRPST